jgi:hypothetical protein
MNIHRADYVPYNLPKSRHPDASRPQTRLINRSRPVRARAQAPGKLSLPSVLIGATRLIRSNIVWSDLYLCGGFALRVDLPNQVEPTVLPLGLLSVERTF